MCQRRDNEPAWSYVFRMVCEKPSGVMAVLGWVVAALFAYAAYVMYADFKAANERQTAAYLEVAKLMSEVKEEMHFTREQLRQLDGWHREEFKK